VNFTKIIGEIRQIRDTRVKKSACRNIYIAMGSTNTTNFGQKSAFVEKRILDLELLEKCQVIGINQNSMLLFLL
jgi:hypothetical protein